MIAFLAIVTLVAKAQNTMRENGTFTLQPKIGAGFGYLSGTRDMGPGDKRKIRTGIVLGVEGEYYAARWLGITTGVNYAMQGWKYESHDEVTVTKLNYINIPFVANFYALRGFALKAGVQFGFLLTAKNDDADWKDGAEKFNFAIPVGLSYEFGNFVIDARYNFAVSPINKVRNDDNRWRSDLIQLTLGYKFAL